MPNLRVTHSYDGQEVRPGLRIDRHSSVESIRFAFAAVCDQANPERWHAEVSLAGSVILQTEQTDSVEKAHHDAEAALQARLVRLFSGHNPVV